MLFRLIKYGAIAALVAFNPLVQGWYLGFHDNAVWQEKMAIPARERTYQTICPAYRDASFVGHWVRPYMWDISWCKNYVSRL